MRSMRKTKLGRAAYFPMVGAMALASVFSGAPKKATKVNAKDTKKKTEVVRLLQNADQAVAGQEPGEGPLDAAQRHYESARSLWEKGQLNEAYDEIDAAFRSMVRVSGPLSVEQERVQDELRLGLSRLTVTLSAAQAGPIKGQSEIPLDVTNEHVKYELDRFMGVERETFIESYKRAGKYLPYILKKLDEEGMPRELAWLPLIESNFKTRVVSPARALGLWQFIPSTGSRFGLKRDQWVDERMDPERATDAAVMYLKELHGRFGDWNTALAAYNCGEGAVGRRIRDQKIEYLDSFWDLYEKLPRETARYVPRMIAVLAILQDPAKYGFQDLGQPDSPLDAEMVDVPEAHDLKVLAKSMNVDSELLQDLNPHFKRGWTPPGKSQLRVPKGAGQVLLAKFQGKAAQAPVAEVMTAAATEAEAQKVTTDTAKVADPANEAATEGMRYRVRKGDTLGEISKRFNVSLGQLLKENGMATAKSRLRVGQTLKIPHMA